MQNNAKKKNLKKKQKLIMPKTGIYTKNKKTKKQNYQHKQILTVKNRKVCSTKRRLSYYHFPSPYGSNIHTNKRIKQKGFPCEIVLIVFNIL